VILGKARAKKRTRERNADSVEENATGVTNKIPQETKTLRESDRIAVTVFGQQKT
jgi:hypothetical protein